MLSDGFSGDELPGRVCNDIKDTDVVFAYLIVGAVMQEAEVPVFASGPMPAIEIEGTAGGEAFECLLREVRVQLLQKGFFQFLILYGIERVDCL